MAFESQLLDGEVIYDDSTPDEVAAQVPEGFSKGREGTSGYSAVPDTFPASLLIAQSEWQARIQEMEEQKSRLSDIINQAGLPCKDQQQTNFCHTEDTEVLTEKGWKAWPDYNWSDLLATMNPVTGMMEFQAPQQRHVYEHDGEILGSTHQRLDFSVTPNHRMLVKKRVGRDRRFESSWSMIEAGSMRDVYKLPHAPTGFLGTELVRLRIPGGRTYYGDDFVHLISLIISDGFVMKSERDKNRVGFCCHRGKVIETVRALAGRCGFSEEKSHPGRFNIWDGALAAWIRENCYHAEPHESHTKKVPSIFKWMSARQIQLFLDVYGDQSHNRPGRHYFSTSKVLIDDLQEMFLRVGRRATISDCIKPHRNTLANGVVIETKHQLYELYPATSSRLDLIARKHISQDRYRGLVYCAGVPNHTLVTRKNGSVLISSNCWINAPTHCTEIVRVLQNQEMVILSPASAGAPIKGFKNVGGWGDEGLQWIVDKGLVPVDKWPANAIDRQYYTAANQQLALDFRVIEWWRLQPRNIDQLISCVLRRTPVAVGYNWWSHEVTGVDPVWVNGKIGLRIRNSWGMNWPNQGGGGYSVLQGSKMIPDDAVAPRTATTSVRTTSEPVATV